MLKSVLTAALLLATPVMAETVKVEATLKADKAGPVINRNIYGQFVEHLGRGVYEGIWVGKDSPIPNTRGIRNDVVAALKHIKVPVVRWPGGCFADDYHWRDGVGPERKPTINSNWNRQIEPNSFGTHEFMDFLSQIDAQPFVSVNVGSGSVKDAQSWMQYMTAEPTTPPGAERARNGQQTPWSVPYVGIGNETWGCGGQMRADDYAYEFRKYAAYVKSSSGKRPFLIAVGPDTDDYAWTETLMKEAAWWRPAATPMMYNIDRPIMDGLSLHFYTLPSNTWQNKGVATQFGEDQWISTMKRALFMDELITKNSAIMDKYDPQKKVALIVDEWGTWYDGGPGGLYQENTLRDALVAAVTLNIFHDHAERVKMANIAQMINVLQAMILTDKDKMILTPTYHVFEMYKVHQDATRIPVNYTAPVYRYGEAEVPMISVSASRDKAGKIHVSVANLDPNRAIALDLILTGVKAKTVTGRTLTAPATDSHNTFTAPNTVTPKPATGVKLKGDTLTANLPAKSVSVFELQ
ncbi:alpha-L-arabinofuranosidase C-terminal domain-containing protein [Asticcacaulis sp. LKC15W]|uniref:non-reducing end alpha-L-arabinofuranosidase n=1 Tax=Asticcacaulis machinosus TaxID=2984211 RepID=A0ABT5HM37_9CAUL|nr:alpha-L-arabinofuranosidase C-terminal domain-containing protein [Asticcacaulis machinosus]